ncbi:MAG: TetR/AcrR family transcriptional regulator, partial [Nevskia sp.]|nr:TetR/AcrR family transcriptional regulator [Nevskia sp.]
MTSTRRSRSEAKRAQLLRIATELFLAGGYDAISVEQIVARAGGTKSNVYKHFGGKAGLFAMVVEKLGERSAHPFSGLPLDAKPEEALRQAGRRFLAELLTPRS